MHAADDFETIRIRMKAIARDEGKPPIELSGPSGNPTQPQLEHTVGAPRQFAALRAESAR